MKSMRSFTKKPNFFPGGVKASASPEDAFAELCRQATAKTLERPSTDLNQQVVDSITTDPGNAPSPQFVASTLRARLQLKNPHKVWLSLELLREVMDKCSNITQDDWRDVMVEINRIASKPMNRYATDLPVQQRAKGAAFSLLRHLANESVDGEVGSPRSPRPHRDSNTFAQHSPRSPSRQGASNGGPPPHAWPRVRQAIQNQLALVNSKLETVQEAVVSLSSGDASGNAGSQQAFLKEVVVEMEGYRSKFEPLLSQLSSFDSPEATQLMSRALETMDVINNIINLQDEVVNAKSTVPQPAAAQLAPPTSPGQPAYKALQPGLDPLDAIAELQQALNGVQVDSSAAPRASAVDPFAISAAGSNVSGGSHASNNPFKPAPYNPMASPATSPSYGAAPTHQQHASYPGASFDSSRQQQGYPSYHQPQQYNGPQTNSSTDSWGGSTDLSAPGQQPQSQPQSYNGYGGYASTQHPQQAAYAAQQPQYAAPQQSTQYAFPQQQHQLQPTMSSANSDAWGMTTSTSGALDRSYSQTRPQSSSAAAYQMQVQPQYSSQPPSGSNPFQQGSAPAQQKHTDPTMGSEWDSLFSRSTSNSAAPASPSGNINSQSQQTGQPAFAPPGLPGHRSAPGLSPALQPESGPAAMQKVAKATDPFDELFSVQPH